jgi:predicted phosphodiesterase
MRFIIIADIHGCYHELRQLVEELNVQPEDRVISVGDIIHKGPYEQDCIRFMMENSEEYILGNHEEKQLRWEKHNRREIEEGVKNPMKHVEDYVSLPDDQLVWVRDRARLFMQINAGDKLYTLVHGGIEPAMKKMPYSAALNKASKREKNVLRTRYVNPKGHMVMLGKEQDEDVYWAEVYDGRFGHVIFGHQPFLNRQSPREYDHCTAIDLGCVYGNVLCAAIIDGDTGEMTYHVVQAHDKYSVHRKETGSTNPIPE